MLRTQMSALAGCTDVVILPEMFTTGFSMQAAALAEPMSGPTVVWLQEQAAALNAAVTGSFICTANGQFYNRLIWMYPDGQYKTYDKKHLFALAEEDRHYTAGTEPLVVTWKDWRIRPLICYDLRFPVWSRNTAGDAGYDLLIYVANWPNRRAYHWQSLLTARAIENQCYVAGVNICGKDGKGLDYNGDSCITDYSGLVMARISGQEGVFTATLSLPALKAYRDHQVDQMGTIF
jgi:predicted amidohydrolase